MPNVEIRSYRAGDEGSVNDGFNAVFGLRRSLEEWRWKFGGGEVAREIVIAVDATGTVVGHYGAVPVPFAVGDTITQAGQIVDIYSRREAREGLAAARVFRTLVRRFVEEFCGPDGLSVTYGFPGPRHLALVRLGPGKHGDREMRPQPVPLWVRGAASRGSLWTSHDVDTGVDAAALDALWARARRRYAIGVVRNAARASRRFVGRPGVEYVHLTVRRGGIAHAWAAVRSGVPATSLADLVWDGESSGALRALDRAVGRIARRAGAARVEMWLSGDALAEREFARCGWLVGPQPDGLHLTAYTFDARFDPASFPGRFYLTMGDADLV